MWLFFAICIYVLIGFSFAEYGFKYLRDNYPSIAKQISFNQCLLIYTMFIIFWFPATLEVLFTHGIKGTIQKIKDEKDDDVQ